MANVAVFGPTEIDTIVVSLEVACVETAKGTLVGWVGSLEDAVNVAVPPIVE